MYPIESIAYGSSVCDRVGFFAEPLETGQSSREPLLAVGQADLVISMQLCPKTHSSRKAAMNGAQSLV